MTLCTNYLYSGILTKLYIWEKIVSKWIFHKKNHKSYMSFYPSFILILAQLLHLNVIKIKFGKNLDKVSICIKDLDEIEMKLNFKFYPVFIQIYAKSKFMSILPLIKLRLNLDKRTWTCLKCIAHHWLHWSFWKPGSLVMK